MVSGRRDYRSLRLSVSQTLLSMAAGGMAGVVVMMLFYRQWWIILSAMILGMWMGPRLYRERLLDKQLSALREEFREALYDLVVALRAGKSLEGAFAAGAEEMNMGANPLLFGEWRQITGQLSLGIPIEVCLRDLADRSGMEEMQIFARTVEVCKRSDGNLAAIMENTIRMITDRMEIHAELKVLLARKKLEQKVMTVMPFVIVAMLLIMSPDYLAPLYSSVRGYLIMAVCAVLSVLSIFLSRKIVQIDL